MNDIECAICLKSSNIIIQLGSYYICNCKNIFYCVDCFAKLHCRKVGNYCPTCRKVKPKGKLCFDTIFIQSKGMSTRAKFRWGDTPFDLELVEN